MTTPDLMPDDCASMEDIRREIDRLDKSVIETFALRYQYVLAAAPFKSSATAVRAPERFAAMLAQRRTWASDNGLNPDVIEKLFHDLVNHFIDEEMRHWQNSSN
ncbi:MAG: isochorismate lyase [Pseudomonadales bacterium]|nr:isochorismate lyase [Pseudomonadales bacterium]